MGTKGIDVISKEEMLKKRDAKGRFVIDGVEDEAYDEEGFFKDDVKLMSGDGG